MARSFREGVFSIKISNVYIEGGDRTREGKPVLRRRRPRMTEAALKELLARHGKKILDDAEADDEARANANREKAGNKTS